MQYYEFEHTFQIHHVAINAKDTDTLLLNVAKKKDVCGKCSANTHVAVDCTNQFKCINCEGDHPAWSRQCSVFKSELDVQKIKITNNISTSHQTDSNSHLIQQQRVLITILHKIIQTM